MPKSHTALPTSWQSWSPLSPHPLRIPAWDYCSLPLDSASQSSSHTPVRPLKQSISYWCSWYAMGENISATTLLEQAARIKRRQLPVDYFLIDDGWTKWGDWQTANKRKFPAGLGALARALHSQHNLRAGLWWAPFLVAPNSTLARQHPNWLVRDRRGRLVNGFRSVPIIDRLFYQKFILDLRQTAVQQYLRACVDQMVNDWSISLLKLDFLYAPYFDPNYQSAAAAESLASPLLEYIRDQYPQVFSIACGCPFTLASGRADTVRISKDNGAPPPYPAWLRRRLYRQRLHLLQQKAGHPQLWQGCLADPDVRIHSFDDKQSEQIWAKIEKQANFIKGYGDILS